MLVFFFLRSKNMKLTKFMAVEINPIPKPASSLPSIEFSDIPLFQANKLPTLQTPTIITSMANPQLFFLNLGGRGDMPISNLSNLLYNRENNLLPSQALTFQNHNTGGSNNQQLSGSFDKLDDKNLSDALSSFTLNPEFQYTMRQFICIQG